MIDVIERENDTDNNKDAPAENQIKDDQNVMTTEQFLSLIGTRVRQYRMDISMSRKLLAKRSGVSERYLAQLESGQGNISIKLLRKVALAINVKLDTLMAEPSPVTVLKEDS